VIRWSSLHCATSSGTTPPDADVPGTLIAVGVLIVLIIVVSILLMAMRRRAFAGGRDDAGMGVFEELRRLHEAGELSDEEFERARQRVIARVKGERGPTEGEHPSG